MPLIKFFLIPCNEFNQVTKLTFFTLKTSYFYLWYSPMFVELTKRLDFSELRPTPTNLTANPALPFMLPQFTSLLCRSEYHNFRHNLSSLSKPFQGKTAVYYWNLKQVLEDIVTTKKNKKTKKTPKTPTFRTEKCSPAPTASGELDLYSEHSCCREAPMHLLWKESSPQVQEKSTF